MKGIESALPTMKENELKVSVIQDLYDAYLKKEENLNGVLNTKNLSLKNQEMRTKMRVWVDLEEFRTKNEDRIKIKEEQALELLRKYAEDITLDKELILESEKDYRDLMAKRREEERLERIVNVFLSETPEASVLDMSNMSESFQLFMRSFDQETRTLE